MSIWEWPSFLSTGFAVVLLFALFWKKRTAPRLIGLAPVMVVVAWVQGCHWLSSSFPEDFLWWKKWALLGELALPVALSYVSKRFLRDLEGGECSTDRSWWGMALPAGLFMTGVLLFPHRVMTEHAPREMVFLYPAGMAIWSLVIVTLVVGLSRLEQILRVSPNPLRFQFKFVLIGLGGVAGLAIVQAIQLLFHPVWDPVLVWIVGAGACVSLGLIGFGLARWRLQNLGQRVQVSHQALYTSFTVFLVGGYLLLVGVVAGVIAESGLEIREALSVLFLFVAFLFLVVVACSRQAQWRLRRLLTRHFFRTKYDYRQKWLEVTEKFLACRDMDEVWDRYLEWLSQTFGAPRMSIWKRFDVDGQFHQIRSLDTRNPPPLPETHPVIQDLKQRRGPFFLHTYGLQWEELGKFGEDTRAHLCVPILRTQGAVMGFCTLSRTLSGREYDRDDFDLLWVVAHQVAMLLLQFQLQEERSSSAKWEAVHRFSAFYLHDLKNLAGSLSLIVQNSEQFGNDPKFQVSAMRTVKRTSQRIIELMGKIVSQTKANRLPPSSRIKPLDMNEVVQEALQGVNGGGCRPVFHPGGHLPAVRMDQESLKQVILNLVMNARQAMGKEGSIGVSTSACGGGVVLEVADTGPGMTSSQLEHLFEPFRSTKKHGLGVGLFQCKRMVEEHHGTIRVESQLGKGTKITVTLPAVTADN